MSRLYIQLGRTGDILTLLPMLHHEAQSGEHPRLMVSKDYAGVLDGVSYVEPVIFDGQRTEIARAVADSKARFPQDQIVCVQIDGPKEDTDVHTYGAAGLTPGTLCTSFDQEPWRIAGRLNEFFKGHRLVFGRRSPEREAELLKTCKVVGTPGRKKPLILVSVKGDSSPFPYADLLLTLVRLRFEKNFHILELPRAERIYDLLALYERAHCLIATDSAPLHLARACPKLPVLALTNDRPMLWHGSAWQPNWSWCCRYHDFPERATEIMTAIEDCRRLSSLPFIHVWNAYNGERSAAPHNQNCLRISRGACGRDSGNTINDPKRVPYLKDCLRMGLARANANELVCLTRPDIAFNMLPIKTAVESVFAYRLERNGDGDTFFPICDLFCARKEWWQARMKEIPDLLLGADYFWSEALRVLFQKHGAKDITGVCCRMAKEKAA